jgi:hypothetical protein
VCILWLCIDVKHTVRACERATMLGIWHSSTPLRTASFSRQLCVHKCNSECFLPCLDERSSGPTLKSWLLAHPFSSHFDPRSRFRLPSHVCGTAGWNAGDCIEYCINQTGDHVSQARSELIKAEEYQSKSRKVKNIGQQIFAFELGPELYRFAALRMYAIRGRREERSEL